jgi:hypothetical protein
LVNQGPQLLRRTAWHIPINIIPIGATSRAQYGMQMLKMFFFPNLYSTMFINFLKTQSLILPSAINSVKQKTLLLMLTRAPLTSLIITQRCPAIILKSPITIPELRQRSVSNCLQTRN